MCSTLSFSYQGYIYLCAVLSFNMPIAFCADWFIRLLHRHGLQRFNSFSKEATYSEKTGIYLSRIARSRRTRHTHILADRSLKNPRMRTNSNRELRKLNCTSVNHTDIIYYNKCVAAHAQCPTEQARIQSPYRWVRGTLPSQPEPGNVQTYNQNVIHRQVRFSNRNG